METNYSEYSPGDLRKMAVSLARSHAKENGFGRAKLTGWRLQICNTGLTRVVIVARGSNPEDIFRASIVI